jgi:hypothetical protein
VAGEWNDFQTFPFAQFEYRRMVVVLRPHHLAIWIIKALYALQKAHPDWKTFRPVCPSLLQG